MLMVASHSLRSPLRPPLHILFLSRSEATHLTWIPQKRPKSNSESSNHESVCKASHIVRFQVVTFIGLILAFVSFVSCINHVLRETNHYDHIKSASLVYAHAHSRSMFYLANSLQNDLSSSKLHLCFIFVLIKIILNN